MPLFSEHTHQARGTKSRLEDHSKSRLPSSPSSSSAANDFPVSEPASPTSVQDSTHQFTSHIVEERGGTGSYIDSPSDTSDPAFRRPSTGSAGSTKKSKSRFLFTSSKPFQPSPTSSKQSSAETTATQSSLASHPPASPSPLTSPDQDIPYTPDALSPSVVSSPAFQDIDHGGRPSSPVNASRRSSGASAFIQAIRDSFRSKSVVESKRQVYYQPASPANPPSPRQSSRSPVKLSSATNLLAEAPAHPRPSANPEHQVSRSQAVDNTHSAIGQREGRSSLTRIVHPTPFEYSDMKRQQSEMEFNHITMENAEYSDLPEGLSNLCLANLGLPFLLFDSAETLVYANESATGSIPALASTSASTSFSFEESGSDTQGDSRSRQRRRTNGESTSTTSSIPASSSASRRVSSVHIFSHAAYDDVDLATARLQRAPDARPFSLSRTLADRKAVGQSYEESSSVPASYVTEQQSGVNDNRMNNINAQRPPSNLRKGESRSPSQVTSASSGGPALNADSASNHSSRTRTSTDGWLRDKYPNQCQPFLHLCGNDTRTWWRSTLSRIEAPNGDFPAKHYYSVLLFQPVIHEMTELIPCDDVSSIKSLSSTATRPDLNRAPSDTLVIPSTIQEFHSKVEDTIPAIPPEFYKAAVECMPQILFTSGRDGIVTYLNPQWYAYTGWDMKTPSREMWADVFHPSDVTIAVDKYSEAIRSGSNIHLHYRVKNKDGQYRWMIARGRCIRDEETDKITGFVCTLTDGQDLIDAQQKAVQTQQYISTVLQASAITLIVIDTARKVVMFEGYTEALDKLGVTGEEAMGRLLEDAWPDLECAEQAQAMLAHSGENVLPEREFATTVGPSNFRYRITPLYESKPTDAVPVYDSAESTSRVFTGLAIVCTDTSAMVRAEKALVQSQKERAELAAREEAAREASRLKTIFVTSLSHEIRTPISGMLGISELLLRDESLSPKHQALVKKQLQAGEVLLQLVSMVLDLGKMEANKLDLENEPFTISDLMRDLDIFASLADGKNIYFERILDVKQDNLLSGDRLRVAQVLSNFISNSVKFTSQGGITLRVEQRDRDDDCLMTFQLEDTGTGIDKETLPHLFKPFHQGNVTIARRFGGSGLGLSIAKTLTELMGGNVTLDSTIGVGTTVRLEIPFRKPNRPSLRQSHSRKSFDQTVLSEASQEVIDLKAQIKLADRREDVSILIAEDNTLLQDVYSALTKKMRFGKIRVVEDGILALEEIEKDLPHVVLMDIEMPRMNGPDAVRVIRSHANPAIRNIKIIALTANAVSGDKERFLAMGMDMYLSKPVRAAKLEEAIMDCLQGL